MIEITQMKKKNFILIVSLKYGKLAQKYNKGF